MPGITKGRQQRLQSLSQARKVLQSAKENIAPRSPSHDTIDAVGTSSIQVNEPQPIERSPSRRQKNPSLSDKLSAANCEIAALKTANIQLEDDLKDCRSSLQAQRAENTSQKKDNVALEAENEDLRRQLRLSQRQVKRAKETNAGLRLSAKQGVEKDRNAKYPANDSVLQSLELECKLARVQEELACVRGQTARFQEEASWRLSAANCDVARIHQESIVAVSLAQSETLDAISRSNEAITNAREEAALAVSHAHQVAELSVIQVQAEARKLSDELHRILANKTAEISHLKEQLSLTRNKVYALDKRCQRHPDVVSKAVARAVAKATRRLTTIRLKHKGIYTIQARALARQLTSFGVSEDFVGDAIQDVAKIFGIRVVDRMSRHTVRRAKLEGGVASKIQIAYEISQTRGMTFSGDGTSHRHINYESRHIALTAPDYSSSAPDLSTTRHRLRFLGANSSLDHKSDSQAAGWLEVLDDIKSVYNRSPMAQRYQFQLKMAHIAGKLKGYLSDHAADQKKLSNQMKSWKDSTTQEAMGEDELLSKDLSELLSILALENEKKIAAAGGLEAWNSLSPAERATQDNLSLKAIHCRLGAEAYAALSDEERHDLDLYIWGGCCMHKDLNSVVGGNSKMMAWWKENDITPPVLLANKDNAAVLRGMSSNSDVTSLAEQRALEVTTRGGVKTTSIAGALFNHKDDKKGHQDSHVWRFKCTFPDTSNTRYHSHCNAAAQLLLNLSGYINYLEGIKARKVNNQWNNMEENLYKALHDIPTLTELAALALYAEAVTEPYMKMVRGPGSEHLNQLDLGPSHVEVKKHVQMIIDEPGLLLSSDATYETGTLDGKKWKRPEVIEVVHALSPRLPHLEPVVVALFTGALETWERFTTEYAPGGLIDLATADEKKLAWMPAANDHNEGRLGGLRIDRRNKPNKALHLYNSQEMWKKNETESFMVKFLPQDHAFIMQEARRIDSSGIEAKRRADQVEHEQALEEIKRLKEAEKQRKLTEKMMKLAQIVLVFSESILDKYVVARLDDQLEVYRQFDKDVPKKCEVKRKAEKLQAVLNAVKRYKVLFPESSGKWLEDMAEQPASGLDPDSMQTADDNYEDYDMED